MRLYLIQHGEATPEEINPSRPLTVKGQEDVRKIALFLKEAGVRPKTIYHSGKTRAKQTAEIIADALEASELSKERKNLLPQDSLEDMTKELLLAADDLMIVGHLPYLSKLSSFLLLGEENKNLIAFQQGGVVCLQRNKEQRWQIAWMIIPYLFK